MKLIDTHSHLHSLVFFSEQEADQAVKAALEQGVTDIICVGTSLEDSKAAVTFSSKYPEVCYAVIGIHPHEAKDLSAEQIAKNLEELADLASNQKVVGIGECGFDFYYNDKAECLVAQEALLRGQIEIALQNNLPLSFHVREAFDEFWRVFEDYNGVKGVLHSFTDKKVHLERAFSHNLMIGINGIATFTTHAWQRELFQQIELDKFVLETDSPFLTPKPKRGTINTSENVIYITKFLAELRGESEKEIAEATSANAQKLFNLK